MQALLYTLLLCTEICDKNYKEKKTPRLQLLSIACGSELPGDMGVGQMNKTVIL